MRVLVLVALVACSSRPAEFQCHKQEPRLRLCLRACPSEWDCFARETAWCTGPDCYVTEVECNEKRRLASLTNKPSAQCFEQRADERTGPK